MEQGLVERARGGDHDAFSQLAVGSVDRLHSIALLMLRDPGGAQDAVQEALVRAWRSLPSLRDADRFDAWLRRLLVHACYDEIRRRGRRPETELREWHDRPSADQTAAHADRDALARGFVRLTAEQRAVVVLRFYQDLSLAEVAADLGIPVGTVKSRLHHAMAVLRGALEADARTGAPGGLAS